MYAVIFRAKLNADESGYVEPDYSKKAERMRELAFEKYDCLDLSVCVEGDEEIAVSYWHSLEDIKAWKQDTEHIVAQTMGKEKWLDNYKVEVCQVVRAYDSQSK